MINVFKDSAYAIQYEQLNLNFEDIYGQFADISIDLAEIEDDSRVLDFGCGTSRSTCKLFDKVSGVRVVGIDQSKEFLEIAKLRYSLLDDPETIFNEIKNNHPYPRILKDNCEIKDLETHLRNDVKEYSKFVDNVEFYHTDERNLDAITNKPFDYVLASQVIHWFRKKDTKPDEPNYDYERKCLQQIRNNLKDGGIFVFNTSAADFKFENVGFNMIHVLNHPFYVAFTDAMKMQLEGKVEKKEYVYTFDHSEIERIMKENEFEIEKHKVTIHDRDPNRLLEVCMIGGQMQIFQKENIDSSIDVRETILENALKEALKKSSLYIAPYVEVMKHYVVRAV